MKNTPMVKLRQSNIGVLHRRAGVLAGLFILILALSGVFLNHTETFELDQQQVDFKPMLAWYGIELPDRPLHFKTDHHIISQLGEQVYISGKPLLHHEQKLVGAISNNMFILLTFQHQLMLLTLEGELIERITELPSNNTDIVSIGLDNNNNIALLIRDEHFIADQDLINWQSISDTHTINWSKPVAMDNAFENIIITAYRGHDLNYERVLLDLHSGRLFGSWGIYLMDIAALLMIFLALSGIYRWQQCRKKHLSKRHIV